MFLKKRWHKHFSAKTWIIVCEVELFDAALVKPHVWFNSSEKEGGGGAEFLCAKKVLWLNH